MSSKGPYAATDSYTPTISRMAREHQYALRGRLKGYIEVQYLRRELLGFTKEDLATVKELLLEWVGD
ncbi:phage virion morphogenesis protein [Shewanella dokdonensis]|uniref:Phage virion morphogenesis protein n=1 Tax=Shewanella dokdonensis TaxID=712036 RepID=A0ABX8DBZ6_9GAMM|nr:phage virion morphogenesis protein [Shewanella dokdonensis]QVK22201.1 phage virion morphogenesis protein [Shewanella dokdonensis]